MMLVTTLGYKRVIYKLNFIQILSLNFARFLKDRCVILIVNEFWGAKAAISTLRVNDPMQDTQKYLHQKSTIKLYMTKWLF